jgi:ABC-type antimicrobial peptide transport system permease subunit
MAETRSSGGIGFAGLLTILFIGLKLTAFINWSWWWVLSPLWISAGFGIIVLVIALAVFLAARSWVR